MRKRNIACLADTIFWYLIYLLPIIAYLLCLSNEGFFGFTDTVNFSEFLLTFTDLNLSNPVADFIYKIFGAEQGLIPIFNDSDVLVIFTWFIYVYLLHLMVDFILFIPRLCHKWMKAFTQGDD